MKASGLRHYIILFCDDPKYHDEMLVKGMQKKSEYR